MIKPLRVGVIGDLSRKDSLGEAYRLIVAALRRRTDIVVTPYPPHPRLPNQGQDQPSEVVGTPYMASAPHEPIASNLAEGEGFPNIFLLAQNFTELALHHTPYSLLKLTRGRPTVGLFVWELPQLPAWTVASRYAPDVLEWVDEIWTPSRFAQEAFAASVGDRVVMMPYPVGRGKEEQSVAELLPPSTASNDQKPDSTPPRPLWARGPGGKGNIPFRVLAVFSASSGWARKNPDGAVEAFRRAFGRASDWVQLTIKADALDRFPALAARLRRQVARVGGRLIESRLSRDDLDALIAHSDVLLSLHRAEGFGLPIAEAMARGVPVIATAYSAPAEFVTAENGIPIPYTMRGITPADLAHQPGLSELYEPGQRWAEPNISAASDALRRLHSDAGLRHRLGVCAQEQVARRFDTDAIAAYMSERLHALAGHPKSPLLLHLSRLPAESNTPYPQSPLSMVMERGLGGEVTDAARRYEIERTAQRIATLTKAVEEMRLLSENVRFSRVRWLGFWMRTLHRVRNLGRLQAAQARLNAENARLAALITAL